MSIAIDIETENTGADIMEDNRRIISVQIGDATKQELYYCDSEDSRYTLTSVDARIRALISQGYTFVGYNVKDFDIPLLRKFLGVEIPVSNVLELSNMGKVIELKNSFRRKKINLETVCEYFKISVDHKHRMNKKSEEYKVKPDIQAHADNGAILLVDKRGWSIDFSRNYALNKIAIGHAIYDSYKEFVAKGGRKDTLFYEYAIGDIVCEFQLLEVLRRS